MAQFKPVNPQINFPQMEEEILAFWKANKTFEKSVDFRPADKHWTFLDGPPFITGLPHYGTLLASIPKDVFPRYWTMKGYKVRRVWGWDVHGLPAENKVEKKLGIKRKRDIEDKVGIKKFIDECREYVSTSSAEWEWYVDHIARWVDFKNAYKTMDTTYMESVMWVFKEMYDKDFIYKGLRVSLYCPHCSTPISNFEVAMDPDNYQDVTDFGTTYKYKITGVDNTFILAWSTTPWNKIVTPALAINPKLTYVKVKQNNETYILAKSAIDRTLISKYEVLEEISGEKLIGLKFEPHYNFYKIDAGKKAFEIFAGDFVTAEEGTGVVTIAAYGEEDLNLMQKENIQIVMHVDDEGKLTADVPKWAGMNYLEVNPLVNADLAARDLVYRDEKFVHSVAHCWRCHTRLYFSPQNAWYVNVQKLKPAMQKTNESINWYPGHFKYGRFLNSMESAPDWCISRSRYWGSPVPVWECECGNRIVPGSIAELEKLSNQKITDLHKPGIDEVVIKCAKCGQDAHRVPEVLDSWIEAGSASFGERHYPFNSELKVEQFFPPDFIVEYTGQIRAWFYVMHVIGCALFDTAAFKNAVVTGVILGTDGKKMSKNLGNYPDPKELIQKYGGDALRLYLMSSPVMHGEDIVISEEEYKLQVRSFLLTLWNCYNFFITYANLSDWKPEAMQSSDILDQWVMIRLNETNKEITEGLEKYDTIGPIESLKRFVSDFSTWYIRRSRDRVGDDFYNTCYQVLVQLCQLLAPIAPFISEEMYKNLTGEESVHLTDWPSFAKASAGDARLLEDMKLVRKICELGLAERKSAAIKVRQPLQKIIVTANKLNTELTQLIKDELNIKEVVWENGEELKVVLDTKLDEQLIEEGEVRELIRSVQEMRKDQKTALNQHINLEITKKYPDHLIEVIKKSTLADTVKIGDTLCVTLV